MSHRIAVIPGDGIGPEIIDAALEVMTRAGEKAGQSFTFEKHLAGGAALDAHGIPLPDETLRACLESDSVLLGAVGGPKWDVLPGHLRPERALLGLRKAMDVYANLRPARLYNALSAACPLRADIAAEGIDLIFVRELTGGLYFGERGRTEDDAFDTERYSRAEIERIVRSGFELAGKRRKKLCSVDKANVLDTSRLWRQIVHEMAPQYPDIEVSDMLVDNCAMQLVRAPAQFDTIVTSNLFGDILSDESAMITGSIGLLPSASLGGGTLGLFEPMHGSAPDIAGKNLANPIATILSAAMLLRLSLGLSAPADAIERAVESALDDGLRTADIAAGGPSLSCTAMTKAILDRL